MVSFPANVERTRSGRFSEATGRTGVEMTTHRRHHLIWSTATLLMGLALGARLLAAETAPDSTIERSRPMPGAGATQVNVGMMVVDLFEVRDAEQSFLADIAILAQWRDPRLAGRWNDVHTLPIDQLWNPRFRIANRRQVETSLPEAAEVSPDGTVLYRQRFTGRFTARLDLRSFPFDEQEFLVQVVCVGYSPEEVDLIPDRGTQTDVGRLSITDWKIGAITVDQMPFTNAASGRTLAGVAIKVPATREVGYFVVQVLLPLVAIIMMSWTVFWIDPSVIPTRVGTVVTTMLTLIAYRFALGTLVPKLPYLTRLDYFLLGATILVLLALLAVAATSYLVSRQRLDLVRTIDRAGRIACPAAFLVLLALVLFG